MAEISRIQELARRLGLFHLAKQGYKFPNKKLSNLDFLELILTKETDLREEKATDRRKRQSKFPNFDITDFIIMKEPGFTKFQLDVLLRFEWVTNSNNIIITGESGVGKTHLGAALATCATEKGFKAYYITLENYLNLLKNANEKKSRNILEYMKECHIIMIDEVGYLPIEKDDTHLFYRSINVLNSAASLIIATNKPLCDFPDIFHDRSLGLTILDRLSENSGIINLRGDSYRKKTHNSIFN